MSEEQITNLTKLDAEREHEEPAARPLDWKSDSPLFLEDSPAEQLSNDQDEKDETVE